jgi:hypothetical protein
MTIIIISISDCIYRMTQNPLDCEEDGEGEGE